MNIRTLTNPIVPVESPTVAQTKGVKTEVSSEDRDADGRRGHDEPNKNPLNEEEMKKAKEYLEKLEAIKAHSLELTIEEGGDIRIFVLRDKEGNIVRRIPEWEMRALLVDSNKKTGQIFDKSA